MKKELDKELYPDYVYPEFTPDPNEPFREPIAKLGKKITDRIPQKLGLKKITRNDPEYWGLAGVLTDEEAELAVKLGVRKPKTLAEIVKLSGLEEKKCEVLLEEMSRKGLLEYNWENPKHEKQYVLPMYVPGCAEFFNMNANILDSNPEMGTFFEHMSRLPLEKITPFVPEGGAGIGMHVIPVEKAIEMENESVDLEHISHWLNKYEGKYAASPCSCRRSRLTHGEGCADDPEGWCIAVGDMADYVVETQKDGRYIDKAEALEILKAAEDNGFVHQITNIDGANKIFAICNCNVNVCYALRTSQLFNTPNMSRSAYVAKVEKANCVACGKCVEFCPAGAVKLGQKLCDKEGCEVQYPRIPLPSEQPWGEHMWSHNYRDVNRINCYDTGTAPCKTACPAHVAVQGYLKLAKEGRYDDALALIKKDNPLPAVCGHVCNRRCEDACTRGTIDEAVAIDEVKRFLAERDLKAETRYIPKKTIPSLKGGFDEKIAIIGAGPAGLSCAFYLAEKGYKPVVFEKNERPGGMLTYGIPSFKLQKDVIEAEVEVIRLMGAEFRYGVEVGRDVTLDELRTQGFKAFYVAIGCQGGRLAGIPGEDAEDVTVAVDFLREVNSGKVDALPGRTIVVGGGNVAIDVARNACRLGSEHVEMFCLESEAQMPASEEERREAIEDGAHISCGWGPKEVHLDEAGRVCGITFKRCTRVTDDEGRFAPEYDESDLRRVDADRVVMSIGQSIVWGDLLAGSKVELGRGQGALADPQTYQTAEPDVFVGGDVYTGPSFAIDAIAAGHEAAVSIHRFVQPGSTLTIGRNQRRYTALDRDDVVIESYDNASREIAHVDREREKAAPFSEYVETFTEEQVRAETARCLGCGASIVDPNKCIGCGLCTTKCAFDAIHLDRDRPECSTMVKYEQKLPSLGKYALKRAIKIKFGKK